MRFLTLRLLLLPLWGLLMVWTSAPGHAQSLAGSSVYQSEQSRAELVWHAPQGLQPGAPVWLGLRMDHAPDWHSYWLNPGDSGLPTELQWTLPEGLSTGAIQWPTPRLFPLGELANYGYDGSVLLPVPLTVSPTFQDASGVIRLKASWLICRQECIPEEADLSLRIGRGVSHAGHAALFQAAWDAAPRGLNAGSSRLQVREQALQLDLADLPAAWRGQTLVFFPETAGLIVPGAPWRQAWAGDRWQASVPLSPDRVDSPSPLALVVALANAPGKGPGLPGVRMTVAVDGGWPAPTAVPATVSPALAAALEAEANRPPPAASATGLGLWLALGGALIGGLILNLMPCVFPVLAIKVMAFAHQGDDQRAHRAAGLAYTAGVVLSFMALGGLLLLLRAAGEQLGWGFQLQNPAVVASLAVLFTLIGLNLAGLFEFGHLLPSRLASLQLRNPSADAFLTGVLAVAIASPCTAPFMGASLGLAVALPPAQALAVFASLGLGMALPYVAASWLPAVARALPRPGAWMETFRQLMAFPMLATVVWLLWVLGQQSGIDGAAALLIWLVTLAWLVWALGRRGRSRTVMALLAGLSLAWLSWSVGPYITRLSEPTPLSAEADAAEAPGRWMDWSPARQAALLAEGRPVLIDFTAAWCVTCQYNKRTALASEAFVQAAAAQRVALLRADWTRRDPLVTQALASLGRNGVPVYAFYRPGQAPVLLSEILTTEALLAALGQR